MHPILKDKYFVFALATALVLASAYLMLVPEPEDASLVGIVTECHQSSNGFVFTFEDLDGTAHRCFSYDEPVCFSLYTLQGSASDDGNMFFVSEMRAG